MLAGKDEIFIDQSYKLVFASNEGSGTFLIGTGLI